MKQMTKSDFLITSKKWACISIIVASVTIAGCFNMTEDDHYIKDLDENMLDLRAYHENLGSSLKQNDLDIAEWLANGMDSVLKVMARHFDNNRKLKQSFSYYYNNRLKPNMTSIKKSIKKGNTNDAIQAYTVLTNKCNSCHTDHDAGKEVINWAK